MEIPWQIMLDSHNVCHPYLEFLCCLQLWPKEWPPKDSWPRPSQDLSWNWLPTCRIRNSPLSAQHPPSPPPHLSKNPTSSHPEEKGGNFYMVVKILERNQPRSCRTSATVFWKLCGAWNSMFFWFKKPWRDFPGGPVVKNLPCSAGDSGLITGWGTKIPHATGQLSPQATTTDPACRNWRGCVPQWRAFVLQLGPDAAN